MLGTPVVVVFLRIPVARPASDVPFILPTTVAPCVPVTSPESAPVNDAAEPVVFWLSVGKSPAVAIVNTPVVVVFLMMPVLVIFANLIALGGVLIVSNFLLGSSAKIFFDSVLRLFHVKDVFDGRCKSLCFVGVTFVDEVTVEVRTEGGAEGEGLENIRECVWSGGSNGCCEEEGGFGCGLVAWGGQGLGDLRAGAGLRGRDSHAGRAID